MTQFTTRVELHDADWDDYTLLHQNMSAQGFTTTVTSDDDHTYKLPPAEYNYSGNTTRAQVLAKAKSAANGIVKSYAVLVTESNGRTWHNLAAAKQNA